MPGFGEAAGEGVGDGAAVWEKEIGASANNNSAARGKYLFICSGST
jgi:hypothetical protein